MEHYRGPHDQRPDSCETCRGRPGLLTPVNFSATRDGRSFAMPVNEGFYSPPVPQRDSRRGARKEKIPYSLTTVKIPVAHIKTRL